MGVYVNYAPLSMNEDAIKIMADAIAKAITDMPPEDYIGFIKGVSPKGNNYCRVVIDNNEYDIKNGIGITFKAGDRCLVHCISRNFSNKVIIAKL